MKSAGVDARYLDAELSRVRSPAGEVIRTYIDGLEPNLAQGKGLYCWGGVGVGKSCAAALVVRKAVEEQERSVRWWSMADLLVALENPYDRKEVLRAAQFSGLLVLDDFGVQVMSQQYLQWFDQIVDARYRRKKATIVTSNVDPAELLKRPEFARAVDRWRSNMVSVPFGGSSLR